MKYSLNEEQLLAFEYIEYTNTNIFLTGKAGTGKTTFLHHIKNHSAKKNRMIVVAPTGVAAVNAGSSTIHSVFQFPPQLLQPYIKGSVIPEWYKQHHMRKDKMNLLKATNLLIIDEISMVPSYVIDAIDAVLRKCKNHHLPFGGVQIVMIGDLQQLSPVVNSSQNDLLANYYDNYYFFSSLALRQTNFNHVEFKHIYRQSDQKFIDLLNKVRENKLDEKSLELLNSRYDPTLKDRLLPNSIYLCTKNDDASNINNRELEAIKEKEFVFKAEVKGLFDAKSYPTDFELYLKKGAQIMFVKNDTSELKRFINGTLGIIKKIDQDNIHVSLPNKPGDIIVPKLKWTNIEYQVNEKTKEITTIEKGSFEQYPLRLAWAITIHKSQGLTFDQAVIDAQKSFTHGQVYVALSRCKTFEGLHLSSKILYSSVKTDAVVSNYISNSNDKQISKELLIANKKIFYINMLKELTNFNHISEMYQNLTNGNILVKYFPKKLSPLFEKLFLIIEQEIALIGDKFGNRINNIYLKNTEDDLTENTELKDISNKSFIYFNQKLFTIYDSLIKLLKLLNEDKDGAAQIEDNINEILEEVFKKMYLFKTFKDNIFTPKEYLTIRDSEISFTKDTDSSFLSSSEFINELSDEIQKATHLLSNLLEFILSIDDNSEYFTMNILFLIDEIRPQNTLELTKIKDLSDEAIEKYGEDIINIYKQE